ncbi:MAG: SDR family NAD(P)-dependent oxidoreductase [Cellvibrionaceae bacterium]
MKNSQPDKAVIVIGSGGIGAAVLRRLIREQGTEADQPDAKTPATTIISISRKDRDNAAAGHIHFTCDGSEAAISAVSHELASFCVTEIYLCTGFLHDQTRKPEKRVEDIGYDAMAHTLSINTVLPALWLAHLVPLLAKQPPMQSVKFVVLSARVGSIADNSLGGWYSYRASKAALNMILKTAAIELKRRARQVKLVSFHPGTTDTALSKPFQRSVPKGKLFQPDFVAERLLWVSRSAEVNGELSYLDWDNKEIAW